MHKLSARQGQALALTEGPFGVSSEELALALGITYKAAANALHTLTRYKVAHSACWPSKRSPHRYFASHEAMSRWLESKGEAIDDRARIIIDKLSAAGGEPVTIEQLIPIVGMGRVTLWRRLQRMEDDSRLVKKRIGRDCVFFRTQAELDAWGARNELLFKERQIAKRRTGGEGKPGAELIQKQRPSVRQPVRIAPDLSDRPIDYSRAIITRDTTPRPTARWQMRQEAPDERWPSFASIPLGAFAMGAA